MVKRKSPKRSYKHTVKTKVKRSGKKLFGGIGSPKGLLIGSVGLMAAQRFQPFGGAYKPAVDKIAVGLVGQAVGMGQSDLLSAGIKEGLATLASGFMGGGGIGVPAVQGDVL